MDGNWGYKLLKPQCSKPAWFYTTLLTHQIIHDFSGNLWFIVVYCCKDYPGISTEFTFILSKLRWNLTTFQPIHSIATSSIFKAGKRNIIPYWTKKVNPYLDRFNRKKLRPKFSKVFRPITPTAAKGNWSFKYLEGSGPNC